MRPPDALKECPFCGFQSEGMGCPKCEPTREEKEAQKRIEDRLRRVPKDLYSHRGEHMEYP